MKIERLLSMTIMLLNRRKIRANDLADHFEVSVRTIYRDVETLNRSGIPVVSFQGYGGGFCIPDNYKISRQLLTFSDMLSILTTLKGVNQTLNSKEVSQAIEKITALIPSEKQDLYRQHSNSFSIDIRPWGSPDRLQETIVKVHEGVTAAILLAFDYTSAQGETVQRKVEPHTLVFKGLTWYLLGFCRVRNAFRIFKLSRIRNLSFLKEHFARRQVDPAAHFNPENDSRQPIEIILKFSPGMGVRVEENLGPKHLAYDDDGSITATITLPEGEWLHGFLLSFGENVEIISPARLRTVIKEKIHRMKKIYTNLT